MPKLTKKTPRKAIKTETGCRPAQLFGEWAIEPTRFREMFNVAKDVDLAALAEQHADSPSEALPTQNPELPSQKRKKPYNIDDNGIAQLSISGPMTKYQTSFQSMFGGCATLMLRQALRMADADPDVDGVMLMIDSPGGTVDGTADLAADIRGMQKPCFGYISDTGCSAAYWAASQCDRVYANTTAKVGSIGVLMVLEDTSEAYKQDGIKVHVISTGDMKGAGTDGAPVTDKQLEYFQQIADDVNQLFIKGIAEGRGMSLAKVKALADGRVHVGDKAQTLGLVDSIASFDDASAALSMEILKMTDPTAAFKAEHPDAYQALYDSGFKAGEAKATPKPATVNELKTAFPAHSNFVIDQLGLNATLADAKAAFADVIAKDRDADKAKILDLEKKLAASEAGFQGIKLPIQGQGDAAVSGDAITKFEGRVNDLVKAGKSRVDAVNSVATTDPALHEQYLAAKIEAGRAASQARQQAYFANQR